MRPHHPQRAPSTSQRWPGRVQRSPRRPRQRLAPARCASSSPSTCPAAACSGWSTRPPASGATLVLRGLKAQSMRQTLAAVGELIETRTCVVGDRPGRLHALPGQRRADLRADPGRRAHAGHTGFGSVPELPRCAGTGCAAPTAPANFLSVSGDVSLDYALDAMLRAAPKPRRARARSCRGCASHEPATNQPPALLIAALSLSVAGPIPVRRLQPGHGARPQRQHRGPQPDQRQHRPIQRTRLHRQPAADVLLRQPGHLGTCSGERRMPARDRATAVAMPRRPATRSTSRRPTPPAGRASASRRTIRC
jgi:hypothetical protein